MIRVEPGAAMVFIMHSIFLSFGRPAEPMAIATFFPLSTDLPSDRLVFSYPNPRAAIAAAAAAWR